MIWTKITYRLLALITGLIAMNFIYERWFHESDLQLHSSVINKIRAVSEETKVLYLGESSNNTFRSGESDERSISTMIDSLLPKVKVSGITNEASHSGIYKTLLKNIDEDIDVVVITLNSRSFGAGWKYSSLETPLQKSMVMLQNYPPLLNRLLLSFKNYDIKSAEERSKQVLAAWSEEYLSFEGARPYSTTNSWDYHMAITGIKDSSGQRNQAKTELACHYIKSYAFELDTVNDIRIKDFDEIIRFARSKKWKVVLNLLAENTDKADLLVGSDLLAIMERNRKKIVDYFQSRNVAVVDNYYEVRDSSFIDQNWTTEHYDQFGRMTIAQNVADEIRRQFYSKH